MAPTEAIFFGLSVHFHGILRVKNEARWIARVVCSLLPMCERIHVLDDHSTDETPDICESITNVTVYRSTFEGLDESRDRDFLLQQVIDSVPWADLNENSPHIVCAIDGDEVLQAGGQGVLRNAVRQGGYVWSPRILYLWNNERQWRTDGVYGQFRRPSFFRLISTHFRYQRTPFGNGANFHCSSIPQELLHYSTPINANLLHLGYLHRDDRLRKYAWYTAIDPNNAAEDGYLHMVQGDIPEVPADARLKHAGPLQLQQLN